MQDTHPDDDRTAYEQLAQQLAELEQPTRVDGDGIWLTNWEGVRISIAMLFVAPRGEDQWLARIDLVFSYNVKLPYAAIATRAVGVGGDRVGAIAGAVHAWIAGTAPPLISHIYGECRYGADYAPDGEQLGVDGWNCITGPYVVTGKQSIRAEVTSLVREHPMIVPVRELLQSQLDRDAYYHSLVLYRARTIDSEFADVLIDNHGNEPATEILKQYSLPRLTEPDGFIGVRQFILCCRPQ